jgi:YVTN family beta-propeller protein
VEGLGLSSDGGTLYAALAADDAVGVIDTATLTQTREYATNLNTDGSWFYFEVVK